jgi:hypothetical protein
MSLLAGCPSVDLTLDHLHLLQTVFSLKTTSNALHSVHGLVEEEAGTGNRL